MLGLFRLIADQGIDAIAADDGNLTIGFWIILVLFGLSFFCAFALHKHPVAVGTTRSQTLAEKQQQSTSTGQRTFISDDSSPFGRGVRIWLVICVILQYLTAIPVFRINWLLGLLSLFNAVMSFLLLTRRNQLSLGLS
jgi:hypothetical protein